MRYRRPAQGPITHGWGEPRPLTVPQDQRNHNHGAVDIPGGSRDALLAPADCTVYHFAIFRQPGNVAPWSWPIRLGRVQIIPWGTRTYDVYGAVTVLDTADGNVHLFCHSWFRSLWEVDPTIWEFQEQPDDIPNTLTMWHTFANPRKARAGEEVAMMGSAGQSDMPHLHWEIHKGWTDTPFSSRPNPEDFL